MELSLQILYKDVIDHILATPRHQYSFSETETEVNPLSLFFTILTQVVATKCGSGEGRWNTQKEPMWTQVENPKETHICQYWLYHHLLTTLGEEIRFNRVVLHIECLSNKLLTTWSRNGPEVTIKQEVHLALNCDGS